MNLNDHILVVVNPSAEQQPALDRAARLAAASGVELRMQAIVYEPQHASSVFHWHEEERSSKRRASLDATDKWLKERAATLGLPKVSTDVFWGHPFDEALLSVVAKYQPDLVFMQPREVGNGPLSLTEWRFLSRCPAPVWLARSADWPAKPKIAAAVDPAHADDKPACLDRLVIAAAGTVSQFLGCELHLVHALGSIPSAIGVAQSPQEYERELRASRNKKIKDLLPEGMATPASIEMTTAEPLPTLLDFCKERSVDLVTMGMLARSRLSDFLIGSTAREFIPRSRCDVLLIKPTAV